MESTYRDEDSKKFDESFGIQISSGNLWLELDEGGFAVGIRVGIRCGDQHWALGVRSRTG